MIPAKELRIFTYETPSMYFRRLPNTDIRRLQTLEKAYESMVYRGVDTIIGDKTLQKLTGLFPEFSDLMQARMLQSNQQTKATARKKAAFNQLKMTVSHFLQVLNFGIMREVYSPDDRTFFGIESTQGSLPALNREQDVKEFGSWIISGESQRKRLKLIPITNPDAAEVESALQKFEKQSSQQEEIIELYHTTNSKIEEIRPVIDELILDIWDEIDFYYRKKNGSEKRKLAAGFGVFYEKRDKTI